MTLSSAATATNRTSWSSTSAGCAWARPIGCRARSAARMTVRMAPAPRDGGYAPDRRAQTLRRPAVPGPLPRSHPTGAWGQGPAPPPGRGHRHTEAPHADATSPAALGDEQALFRELHPPLRNHVRLLVRT